MKSSVTLNEQLQRSGISRRTFLKFCATTASLLALPQTAVPQIMDALGRARRPSVIWLPFQECTGCTEAILRSHAPTLESLIFDHISLDYQHTIMAAAGDQAEFARTEAMKQQKGQYLLLVDGSVPLGNKGYSTISGQSNVDMLEESAEGAAAIIAIGTCASFGGIPKANPNPTGAVPISEVITDKPIINLSGCPPLPIAITAVLVHYLTFKKLPALDSLNRPLAFFGETIHDRCYRRPFYERRQFARSFDDEGAKAGWCLFELGCKGPETFNACATVKWNQGTSFPIESGHPCLGCSEPDFWDKGSFYQTLGHWGRYKAKPGAGKGGPKH
ncbi:MAG: hydrogenase small subunit [Bacteroidota bacterium]